MLPFWEQCNMARTIWNGRMGSKRQVGGGEVIIMVSTQCVEVITNQCYCHNVLLATIVSNGCLESLLDAHGNRTGLKLAFISGDDMAFRENGMRSQPPPMTMQSNITSGHCSGLSSFEPGSSTGFPCESSAESLWSLCTQY